jgi:L-glyceraldehyde 3-phosphate reductase
LLTNKYLNGIPKDSRAASENSPFLSEKDVERTLDKVRRLNEVAQNRNQSLAQLAVAWILRLPVITSVLIGASRVAQVEDCVAGLANLNLHADELTAIESILAS